MTGSASYKKHLNSEIGPGPREVSDYVVMELRRSFLQNLIETLADLPALSFRNAGKMGKAIRRVYDVLGEDFEVYDNERVFRDDLVKFCKLLFSSQLFDDLSVYWRDS